MKTNGHSEETTSSNPLRNAKVQNIGTRGAADTTSGGNQDPQYSIMEWECIRLPVGLAYTVTDTRFRLGVLIVCDRGADQPDQPSLRVQTIDTSSYGSPSTIYMDEAAVLPTELQKAIARRRLTKELHEIREIMIQNSDTSSNPALFIYDSCFQLERRLDPDEVTWILEALSTQGDEVGLSQEDVDYFSKRLGEYTDVLGTVD